MDKHPLRFWGSWIFKVILGSFILYFLYNKSNHIIALTRGIQSGLKKYGVKEKNIDVITNGADTKFFKPNLSSNLRDKFNLNDKFIVMYTGTFGFIHGFETIVEAAKLMNSDKYIDIVILLIGDGMKREYLDQSIKHHNLKNLRIIPPVSRKSMPQTINSSDICLATTHKSAVAKGYIPSKMFEYMACAKPIILGIDGEASQIISQSESGICVGSENPEGIVQAIIKLKDDRVLREKLGKNGRRIVTQKYSRDSISKRYYDVISKVV